MTGPDWGLIERVFHDASRRPAEGRTAWVHDACNGDETVEREVLRLLEADARPSVAIDSPLPPPEDDVPERLGPYRLIRRLGEGGMGAVWLAERDDDQFQRRVAIKLIKRGMDTDAVLRRFTTERQVLASLEHPNIARLLDAGATPSGQPYLVMESVEGMPLDQYCDSRRLTVRERIELFLRVCDAVSHAHGNLVVHRDLKPSNIFVTPDGDPKLFDFGIAKLLSHDQRGDITAPEQRVLTPRYASPEQIRGEPVSTATDVYSLGIVLYELLSGHSPFGAKTSSRAELQREICEREPSRPSGAVTQTRRIEAGDSAVDIRPEDVAMRRHTDPPRLRRQLAGDLDTIVLTAIRKEPQRRYRSVEHLAEDLRAYLEDRPVSAQPDTIGYRSSKFVRRYRAPIVAAAALFALLTTATAVSVAASIRAERARAESETQRLTALRINEFLQGMLQSSHAREGGPAVTVAEMLEPAADQARRELAQHPQVLASILYTIGEVHRSLSNHDEAESLLRESLQIRTETLGENHIDTLASAGRVALALSDMSRFEEAAVLMKDTLARQRETLGSRHVDTLLTAHNYGRLLQDTGRYEEAEPLLNEALEGRRAELGPSHPETLIALTNVAAFHIDRGDYELAEPLLRETIDVQLEVIGEDHIDRLKSMNDLAIAVRNQGRNDEALDLYSRAIEGYKRRLGEAHMDTLIVMANRGGLLRLMGRLEDSESEYAHLVDLAREHLPSDHYVRAVISSTHGLLLCELGRFEDAETQLRNAITRLTESLGPDAPHTLSAQVNLGHALTQLDQHEEAWTVLDSVITRSRELLGPSHPREIEALRRMIELCEKTDDARLDSYRQQLEEADPGGP